jgi:DNA invertase Pin-like site-specific DNA recombinase
MSSRDSHSPTEQSGKTHPISFGRGASGKIHAHHLDRLAIVYIRQSSPHQVIVNRESRERQYAMAGFAERLGWSAERVLIVDDDQGQSAKMADRRLGFQRLMTEVSLNHVGIILGIELSRLARSNKDWHQLIDVCGVFQTLLCDEDAIYDPLDSNDRLLLGMRGAMSEFELVTMRNRLLRGSRNKAERGELFNLLPMGYLKLPTGEVIQEPDEQARGMVQFVLDKFHELGSAYAVYQDLIGNDLQLGFRVQRGARRGELEWRDPLPTRIIAILKHPFYAGAYAYPIHRPGKKNPVTGKTEGGTWFVPPEEFDILIRDRLPAYISWDQYLANLDQLKQNRSLKESRGVPRRGEALLAGLVECGQCGYRMLTKHREREHPTYHCNEHWQHPWEEPCGGVRARPVDELVAQLVLKALEPASLELSLQAAAHGDQERARLHDQWQKKRERARQDAERAERQYQAVEPENRLVARTLEARWEAALHKQRQVEEEYHRFAAKLPRVLSDADRERIRHLAGNVADLWNAAETTMADRKQIVRCLVDKVIVIPDRCSELVDVTIEWQGGYSSEHQIARPVGSYEQLQDYEQLVARIRELDQQGLRVAEIAEKLNEEGFVPPRRRGKHSVHTLTSLMRKLGLVGELFRDTLLEQDEWWAADLARTLKVTSPKIHYWARQGWVRSRRTPSGKHWIIWADAEELHRLRKLATKRNSYTAAKNPTLVLPKARPNS